MFVIDDLDQRLEPGRWTSRGSIPALIEDPLPNHAQHEVGEASHLERSLAIGRVAATQLACQCEVGAQVAANS